jgi:hypothetical protein
VGLQVVYNAPYVKNELRVRFSNRPGWLTVDPASGVTAAGECDTLLVGFNASGLADGDYSGAVRIQSNDLDEPMTLVPCDLHVGVAPAALDLEPNTLNRSSHGNWVSGKVTPPTGYPPEDILTSSVLLVRTVPVATGAPISYTETQARYKFDRSMLQAILPVGDAVPVEVIGRVDDQTWFSAFDTIRVLKPAMSVSAPLAEYGSGDAEAPVLSSGTTVHLNWQDPDGYTATSYQLWYSADAGESWTLVVGGLTQREYDWAVPAAVTDAAMLDLAALDAVGVMGSWLSERFEVSGGTTGVDEVDVPDRFGLRFAGANPARHARLELALPVAGRVEVNVHDIRGALIRELAAGELAAGRHDMRWDGADASGRPVQSGMYFIRARAGGQDVTLRFLLMR